MKTLASPVAARLADPTARVLVLTGAGISAPSGLPTYRGEGGLYPTGALIPLRSSDATSRKVADLWARLANIRDALPRVIPSGAHVALARFAADRHVTVVTQNVDGLHTRAGSRDVIELHGNLTEASCLNPRCPQITPDPQVPDPSTTDGVPRCECGSRLRPNVVLFGERISKEKWQAAHAAAFDADVVLAVGTSLQVHPAASLVGIALQTGAVGAWLDVDPAAALAELDPWERDPFTPLELIAGSCETTLPSLLDTPPF